MIYLESFSIPTQKEEEDYYEACRKCNDRFDMGYPFRVLSALELDDGIDFDEITILHGGNGTGKSTLIKVIAAKLGVNPESLVDTDAMERYIDLCDYRDNQYYDDDKRDFNAVFDIGRITRLLMSDDIFDHILTKRKENQRYDMREDRLAYEWEAAGEYKIKHIDFETGEGVEEFKRARSVSRKRWSQFLNEILGARSAEHSNGESSLLFFTERITPGHLYLLDEPENSLSAAMQLELAKMITLYAQRYECQFIIATHSPFLLAIQGAKIYDLDCYPVELRKWYELESVQTYQRFFQLHASKFI